MDRKQKVSLVVVSAACALLAVTVVTASSWMPSHTPLYSIRMEQASSQMNFLSTDVNTVTYTAENGCSLNYYVAGDEVKPLDYTNVSVTCADTCVTCVSTCSSTCVSTCSSTCASTCSYTCVNTCCTCVNTCENTCVSTCSSTCASTCSYTCVNTCYTCVSTCPNTCLDTCYPCV